MARIRTIKPDFYRHEGLQDLEAENVGKYPMMVFSGLWGHCDKAGRFEWKPRQLKLDILPFLPFDMAETLDLLVSAGFVKRYSVGGKEYGLIESFSDHQRLSGKELQEPEKYPSPSANKEGSNGEATGKQSGSDGDQQESQEWKGREEEGNGDMSGNKFPVCPHKKIISLFADCLPELTQVRTWDGSRSESLAARWRWVLADLKGKGKPHDEAAGLDFFRRMFGYVKESDFLMGRRGEWMCDLPWLVKAENFSKVIEGKYENREAA